jgi:hypothetical protein
MMGKSRVSIGRTMSLAAGIAVAAAASVTVIAQAAGPVIPLMNGPNAVDVLGDGSQGQILVTYFDNSNAHGYSLVNVSVRPDKDSTRRWQQVPFQSVAKGTEWRETLHTVEGADCILSDVRVLRHAKAPVEFVLAIRDFGKSYADAAPVRFEYYQLKRNTDEIPGSPAYYFERAKVVKAAKSYCDVNVAFDTELKLGRAGLASSDATK